MKMPSYRDHHRRKEGQNNAAQSLVDNQYSYIMYEKYGKIVTIYEFNVCPQSN